MDDSYAFSKGSRCITPDSIHTVYTLIMSMLVRLEDSFKGNDMLESFIFIIPNYEKISNQKLH